MYTYEDAYYLAAQCVGFADLYAGRDDAINLSIQAGFIRGLCHAGEHNDSPAFLRAYTEARDMLTAAQERHALIAA